MCRNLGSQIPCRRDGSILPFALVLIGITVALFIVINDFAELAPAPNHKPTSQQVSNERTV